MESIRKIMKVKVHSTTNNKGNHMKADYFFKAMSNLISCFLPFYIYIYNFNKQIKK